MVPALKCNTVARTCRCGCGQALPPGTDRASRATRYLPGHRRAPDFPYEVDEATGCWIWQGTVTRAGHGGMTNPDRRGCILAHRYIYEQVHGPLDEGMAVHHLCPNKLCVNPEHLVAVTATEHRSWHALRQWERHRARAGKHLNLSGGPEA